MIGPSTRLGQNFNPGTSNNHYPAASQPAIGYPGRDGAAMHAAPPAGGGRSQNPPPPRREPTPSGDVCRLLSLLADKTRLRILKILAGGERPVVALTAELRLPQPTVSHHLAWLRMMDLVSPRRQGKHVYYALGAAAHWEENGVLTLTADDATVTITPNRPA